MTKLFNNDPIQRDAGIDPTGKYRWWLLRYWGTERIRAMLFIMLNPSTADAKKDDPTIRRCMGFARENRCNAILVVNLFAYRATSPTKLFARGDKAVGENNDTFIRYFAESDEVAMIVAAWGCHGGKFERGLEVLELLKDLGCGPIYCFGKTTKGHPRHPLYLKKGTALELMETIDAETMG